MEQPGTLSFAAFNVFRDNLYIFMDQVLTESYGEGWRSKVYTRNGQYGDGDSLDLSELGNLFYEKYNIFEKKLPKFFPKQLLSVIKAYRNRVMHQHALSYIDAYRVIDLMCWCLEEIKIQDKVLLGYRDKLFEYIHTNLPIHEYIPIPKEESKDPDIEVISCDPVDNKRSIDVDEILAFSQNNTYLCECRVCMDLSYKSEAYLCTCKAVTCFQCLNEQIRSGITHCRMCNMVIPANTITELSILL